MKDVRTAVKLGLRGGYRLLDASPVYLNEEKIGHTLAEKIEDGSIKREELFIIDKVYTRGFITLTCHSEFSLL